MHFVSYTVWSLVGLLAYLGAIVNAAGILEIDLIFPRTNETYAPTSNFPIVFALQNAELAKHLKPTIRSATDYNYSSIRYTIYDLAYANLNSEPYFLYHYANATKEGPYRVFATTTWRSCHESGDQVTIIGNLTRLIAPFHIKKGAQEVNLVAATETCSAQDGVALSVTDIIHEVPPSPDQRVSGTCAVLASSSPTLTANPCRVKIDTVVAASMSASLHNTLCRGLNPPADCPEENTAQLLVVAGVASLASAFGAIGFLLV